MSKSKTPNMPVFGRIRLVPIYRVPISGELLQL
jgi:hypothetical protein